MKGEFGRKTLAKLRPDCPGAANAPPRRALPDDLRSRSSSISAKAGTSSFGGISSTRSINPERQLPKGNTDKIHKVGCAFGQITNIQNDRRSVQLALKCFW